MAGSKINSIDDDEHDPPSTKLIGDERSEFDLAVAVGRKSRTAISQGISTS
jgi:hypothetical protein